jgi:hypothetical protein
MSIAEIGHKDFFKEETTRLDTYFFSFIEQLTPDISKIALDKRSYIGTDFGDDPHFHSLYDLFKNYNLIPLCFKDEFSIISKEDIRSVIAAVTFGALFAYVTDKLMDKQSQGSHHKELIFLSNMLFAESLKNLYKVIPPHSLFWLHFNRYFREYHQAIIQEEHRHINKLSPYSKREFFKISKGKLSLVKIGFCALAFVSKREDVLPTLDKAFDCYSIATQLRDDAIDWEEDFINKQYTHLLTNVILSYQSKTNSTSILNISEITAIIFSSDILESTFEESNIWFKQALKYLDSIDCKVWKQNLESAIQKNCSAIEKLLISKFTIIMDSSNY